MGIFLFPLLSLFVNLKLPLWQLCSQNRTRTCNNATIKDEIPFSHYALPDQINTLIYPTYRCCGCPPNSGQEQFISSFPVKQTFSPSLLRCVFPLYLIQLTFLVVLPIRQGTFPYETSLRFSSCGAHYGVMNPQRVVGAGIEPARHFGARDFKSLVSTYSTTRPNVF